MSYEDTMMKTSPDERIESLKKQQAEIKEKIAKLEAQRSAQARKEETRLKVLVGAAMLADAKVNPATPRIILEILERAVTAERDRKFLEEKGWPLMPLPKNNIDPNGK